MGRFNAPWMKELSWDARAARYEATTPLDIQIGEWKARIAGLEASIAGVGGPDDPRAWFWNRTLKQWKDTLTRLEAQVGERS